MDGVDHFMILDPSDKILKKKIKITLKPRESHDLVVVFKAPTTILSANLLANLHITSFSQP